MPSTATRNDRPGAPTLVFIHANGFVGETYGVLFDHWRAAGWRVLAPDKLGHDPAHPVTSGWPHLRDELLAYLRREVGTTPVVLAGHSMGGYLSLLVASRLPATQVRAVVLLDAPIVAGWRSQGFRVLKATGLIRHGGPGKVSARRRMHWPDLAHARSHFAAKRAFAAWNARCLDHWLQHGFERAPDGGVQLAFRRDIETRIYDTLPHHLGTLLHRHAPKCPVAFLAGTQSVEMRQGGIAASKALAHGRFATIEGGHLFPMEKPDETAAAVLQWVEGMGPRL